MVLVLALFKSLKMPKEPKIVFNFGNILVQKLLFVIIKPCLVYEFPNFSFFKNFVDSLEIKFGTLVIQGEGTAYCKPECWNDESHWLYGIPIVDVIDTGRHGCQLSDDARKSYIETNLGTSDGPALDDSVFVDVLAKFLAQTFQVIIRQEQLWLMCFTLFNFAFVLLEAPFHYRIKFSLGLDAALLLNLELGDFVKLIQDEHFGIGYWHSCKFLMWTNWYIVC